MKYYEIEQVIEKAKVSRSTIDRFYNDYPDFGNERIDVGKRKNIPESHFKYLNKDLMIKVDRENNEKIKNLQKVISLARDKNCLASRLWYMEWVYFGTISYSSDYSKDTCYNKMIKMYNQLKNDLHDPELKIFFTTESYDVRGGNHNHFVIDCNSHNVNQVDQFIREHFRWHRVDLEKYNPEEAGLFYLTKEGLEGTDWDYLN